MTKWDWKTFDRAPMAQKRTSGPFRGTDRRAAFKPSQDCARGMSSRVTRRQVEVTYRQVTASYPAVVCNLVGSASRPSEAQSRPIETWARPFAQRGTVS